jgi:DNA-binding response OmpR family regulator
MTGPLHTPSGSGTLGSEAFMTTDALITTLLVEDDVRLAELTREYLQNHGVVVHHVADGEIGLREAMATRYDVILLDLMLPGMDGMEVCRRIREHADVPIIMLTARGEEADRVMGLELGADDYLPKPFSPRELLARMRAQVRRARGQAGPSRKALASEGLHLDPGARRAVHDGEVLDLTSYEFDLLYALVDRAGRVLSRESLMEHARGNAEEAFDRSVDVHVSRLRQKLGDDPKKPRFIKTVRGVGYQFIGPQK